AVVIRNVNMSGTDHRVGANILWYGKLLNHTSRTPWTNYLASKLLSRAPAVAPNLAAYWTYDASGGVNDFVNFNNKSPDPLGAAPMFAFDATPTQLAARGFQGIPGFKAMCMLAYQLARTQVSHVISFDGDTALGGTTYDTHSNNVAGQLAAGLRYFRPISR